MCLWDVFGMISEWYRNGIGMPSGSFWLPKFQGFVCLNFIFYFVGWKVEIRQMCYMILLVFVVDRGMSQNRLLLTPEKILTMKLYCSPPNNSDGIFSASFSVRFSIVLRSFSVRSPFVLRSFSVCSPFVLRSFSVHPPLILRSFSVRSPFNLRSSSVRVPFGNRGTNGERSKNHRR